jgi:hypothetical protein
MSKFHTIEKNKISHHHLIIIRTNFSERRSRCSSQHKEKRSGSMSGFDKTCDTTEPEKGHELDDLSLSDEEEEDKNFDEWVEDDDSEPVKSLFSEQQLPSIQALIEHDRERFGFDLQQVVSSHCTDDISYIKLINFLRTTVQAMSNADTTAIIAKLDEEISKHTFLEGDVYMRPVLPEDPLLYLYEDFFTGIAIGEDDAPEVAALKSIQEVNEAEDH